ncbi:MAG: FeoA family protein [Thermodesulfobacteriota bacterium]|nr:FeoA family protein [Thermodesulfobacteriota bacterium]
MENYPTPLTTVLPGNKVRIISLAGGRGLQERLISMGLCPGSKIEVIQRGAPGPFIVALRDCRLAIGTGMAQKIMVLNE